MIKSKIIKILWIVAMVITQILSITSKVNAASIGETKDLERGELGYYCVQKWNGSRWIYLTYNQTFYTDTDGQRYIAYCLSPGLPGVGYVSGEKETYQVRINETLNNDVIWRVLKNGYPNKSIEELDVETADDAYFATMQAINAILRGYSLEQAKELYSPGQFAINGESLDDIQRRGNKTLNAMYHLIDIGLNGIETREKFLDLSIEKISELKEENDEFYYQIFKVQSQSEVLEFTIDKIENLPQGAFIADLTGKQKQKFNGGEQFKIMIPRDSIVNDIKGKISIKAIQKNYPIYYGASTIEGCQDYALCNNSYSEVYASQEIYNQTDKSKLVIKKVDSNTKKPIEGVKFQITSTEGIVNTFVTDRDGMIVIPNQRPGEITIKEIETVSKYRYNPEEIKVELKYNEIKEIEIENEVQNGDIKVVKVDKDDNNIKLSNVEFQLRDEKENVINEGITNEEGELMFQNVIIGRYTLVEVKTNDAYKLLDRAIPVDVIDGKVQEIYIENEKIEIVEEPKEENDRKEEADNKVPEEKERKLPKTGVEYYTIRNGDTVILSTLGVCILKKFLQMLRCNRY